MKSRFCPSPTGYMHLGNLRTALFNVLLAQHEHGNFVIRIEDTDSARSEEVYTHALLNDLRWLNLQWHEGPDVGGDNGPYWQSQRHAIYDSYYAILQEQGQAYPCFCSDEQLALNRKIQRASGQPPRYPGTCRALTAEDIAKKIAQGMQFTLRFHVPNDQTIEFDDLVRGKQFFKSDDIGDFIIRRADGTASFMFCNVVDDALMGVTHALRGEDHLTNTPRQLLIARALNLTPPRYGHISLILGSDGSPLSKRNGSRSVIELREEGYLPLALLNYLARLGHHYAENTFMSLQQLASIFSLDNLQKAPARFDENQLNFWQKEAIMQSDHSLLWNLMKEYVDDIVPQSAQQEFVQLIRPNILFSRESQTWAQALFAEHIDYSHDARLIIKNAGIEFFEEASLALQKTQLNYKALCDYLTAKLQVKGKALFQPLRVALTGELHGPELGGVLQIMGEERVKQRFQDASSSISI